MNVCRQGFQSAIHRIFVVFVVLVKTIFSCINLKPDDGFLPYNMPHVFNKTGHGLTGHKLTDSSIRIYETESFSNLPTTILVQ